MDTLNFVLTIISILLSICSIILTIYVAIKTYQIQNRDAFKSTVTRMTLDSLLVIKNEIVKLENKLSILPVDLLCDKMINCYSKLYYYVISNTTNEDFINYIKNKFQKKLLDFYNEFIRNYELYESNISAAKFLNTNVDVYKKELDKVIRKLKV